MRALVFDGSLRLVSDYPEPRRKPGESLIRPKAAGICNTDLEIIDGYMGYSGVLGHEFVGVVVESDQASLKNKRVVGEINLSCGRCDLCNAGMRTHCSSRTVLGIMGHPGVMADLCTLPDSNLHEVPENLSDEAAVFCEPLAAAFEILVQVPVEPGHRVIVLGDGKLGLLVAQVMKSTGADVLLAGHSREKLSLARDWSILTVLTDSLRTEAADVVVDCTGSTKGFEMALELVRPRGVIVVKTTTADKFSINLAPLVINEITVVGSRCGPFEPALKALADGSVRVAEMITKVFPMEQALEAFDVASRPETLKVIIRM
ncbi:MAG: alcohol dehydrogenase [Candidatus Abyssobacteria bacterium SURF_17]|uniref:Alcohol dehydrogenase n=1 Tax=Candidatus Abyssobacteria bacterium SURF_17 TaxID=2093361 RepID=A0A419F2T3_9BACT|nr:MAG: alcohol dehydrogenase [Candidatus Abyssubacteria bacterium SURF_17]